MNLLMDIGHPAHVHYLKNLYYLMSGSSNKIIVTVKSNLTSAIQLLENYCIPYIPIGKKSDSIVTKAFMQFIYDYEIINVIRKYKIDISIGTSVNIAHASFFTSASSIILDDDDDDIEPLFVKFVHPFSSIVLTPDALKENRKTKKALFYPGYHELAYLHPDRFSPNEEVLTEAGINKGEAYFVLRFNSFKAHHDIGAKGLTTSYKLKLIKLLENYGRVFITTEANIESEYQKYQIKIQPHKIHSFIYYSKMFIGDSQTMTTEAAILGVPALKCNSFAGLLSVPNEIEMKYGLCYSFLPTEFNKMLQKIQQLLILPDVKKEWEHKRELLIKNKIDVTGFLYDLLINYPESIHKYKRIPFPKPQYT